FGGLETRLEPGRPAEDGGAVFGRCLRVVAPVRQIGGVGEVTGIRVELRNGRDLLARLVVAAANNPRRLEIELQEVAARGEILRPEADGVLELPAHPPGQRQAAFP